MSFPTSVREFVSLLTQKPGALKSRDTWQQAEIGLSLIFKSCLSLHNKFSSIKKRTYAIQIGNIRKIRKFCTKVCVCAIKLNDNTPCHT